MYCQMKKRRAFSHKPRDYELRDYITKQLVSEGMTLEKFKKLMGGKK